MLRFGKQRPDKIHHKSPPLFNAQFPGKFEEKIHKSFLESGRSEKVWQYFFGGNINFVITTEMALKILSVLGLLRKNYKNNIWNSEIRVNKLQNEKDIYIFNINFLPPPETPHFGPPEQIMCLVSWERTQKRDPHELFQGGLWGRSA